MTRRTPPLPSQRNRSFVVTGAAGFIGRRVVRKLLEQGAESVTAFDLKHPVRTGILKQMNSTRLRIVKGDILRLPDLKKAIGPGSIVIHLAGMTHAGQSLLIPESCFHLNVLGTVRVLEACRLRRAGGILFLSTGLVYGRPRQACIDETHPVSPLNPYVASKLAAETAVFAYAHSYRLPCWVVRPSNVYGPGGHPDAVHSIILRQVRAGEPVCLMDLTPVRDFIHVEDVAEGLIRLASAMRPDLREVVNLSSGRGHSIRTFARAFVGAARIPGSAPLSIRQNRPGQSSPVHRLVLDHRKLLRMTGWSPALALGRGVRRTLSESQHDRSHQGGRP